MKPVEKRIKRLWAISRAIEGLEEHIERLTAKAIMPTHENGNMEMNAVGRLNLIARLSKDKDRLCMELAYLDECINLVEDPLTREILRTRFIHNKSRRETAKIFSYSEERIKQLTSEGIREINSRVKGKKITRNYPS